MSSKSRRPAKQPLLSSPTGCEMVANDRDVLLKDPVILRPTETKRAVETMDDVTNFPP